MEEAGLSYEEIRDHLRPLEEAGGATREQIEEVVYMIAAAGADLKTSERAHLANILKGLYPAKGVTKADILKDVKRAGDVPALKHDPLPLCRPGRWKG